MRHSRALIGAGAAAAVATWWFTDSAPYPYSQRRLLDLPLPFLTLKRLDDVLRARKGERVLEIGPGTGLQSLHVAPQLGPDGRLDVVDVQQEMLDHVGRRAAERGVGNIVPNCADARELPFPEGVFDAAYLVTALGEIADPARALAELRRVLKPSGRLVVGEFFDRHQIRLSSLIGLAERAGLRVTRLYGPPFAYYAVLRPCTTPDAARAAPAGRHDSVNVLPVAGG
ncbi:class I SAM-dependent methyltransferase [Kitasatospora sp. NPDC057198]|uniref:class I SAM-dependent methyltransferase n=1 Tax=Kitasatospora sp. NPDC057198 TaxID=3346046 RepID=UPI003627DF9D